MSLRIIGGEFKGIFLNSPKGEQTRPTSSLVRKAVFDMCQSIICESDFLDLFAGSGAMGLEAISRGARHASFVEEHKLAIQCIKENIQKLKALEKTTLLPFDVLRALDEMERKDKSFDIIYIDPPYKFATQKLLFIILDKVKLFKENAVIFFEEGQNLALNLENYPHFIYEDKRRFGDAFLHRIKRNLPE